MVEAEDESGWMIFSAMLSKQDPERMGYRVVITERQPNSRVRPLATV